MMIGDVDVGYAGIIEAQRKQIKDLKRSIGYANKRAELAEAGAEKQLDASRDAGKMVVEELSEKLAEERAEADLFHAAYVGMCAMHPNRAVFTGHSQQEH